MCDPHLPNCFRRFSEVVLDRVAFLDLQGQGPLPLKCGMVFLLKRKHRTVLLGDMMYILVMSPGDCQIVSFLVVVSQYPCNMSMVDKNN